MKLLNINSSSNRSSSISQEYGKQLIEHIKSIYPTIEIIERHTTYSDLPFVTDEMLEVFFSKDDLTAHQEELVKVSQELVSEISEADILVISAPIYNFSVPASLKAYFDLIARAGQTFKYTENGPEGLLKRKKAYVVMSSGGTEIGSEIDFAGRYVKHFLGFLGITDVEIIKLDQLMIKGEEKQTQAKNYIKALTQELATL